MRKRGARFKRNHLSINPLFSLATESRNVLATQERRALDTLLAHEGTLDEIEQMETVTETAIRALKLGKDLPHIDADGISQALEVCYQAARALRKARGRHETSGVYGFDAEGRKALEELDSLVDELRKPGVITRKVWLMAYQESLKGAGVVIPGENA